MAKYAPENIRNIALCGHRSCGKTTLVDRMLNFTKTVTRPASVDDGTSICDFDEEEKNRKFTVEAKVTHFEHADKRRRIGVHQWRSEDIGSIKRLHSDVSGEPTQN